MVVLNQRNLWVVALLLLVVDLNNATGFDEFFPDHDFPSRPHRQPQTGGPGPYPEREPQTGGPYIQPFPGRDPQTGLPSRNPVDRYPDHPVCQDNSEHCGTWAEMGNCLSPAFKDYMARDCKYSCNLCPLVEPITMYPPPGNIQGPLLDCKDQNVNCAAWARAGQCTSASFRDYMQLNCKESCGLCPQIQPVDPYRPVEPVEPLFPGPINGNLQAPCAAVLCPQLRCMAGYMLTYEEGQCCPKCVTMPQKGCEPVLRIQYSGTMEYKGMKCRVLEPIVRSACFGVCASGSLLVSTPTGFWEYPRCQCCQSSVTRQTSSVLECTNAAGMVSNELYFYDVILDCACKDKSCPPGFAGPNAFAAPAMAGREVEQVPPKDLMDSFDSMIQNIDNFNRS